MLSPPIEKWIEIINKLKTGGDAMDITHSKTVTERFTPDGFECYVNDTLCSMDYGVIPTERIPVDTALCMTNFGGVHLGVVDVFRHEGAGLRWGNRAQHHIRKDHVDDIFITIPTRGQVEIKQSGKRLSFGLDNFVFLSTSKPFSSTISESSGQDAFLSHLVRIPGAVLRKHVPRIDHCCDQIIQVRSGASKVMVELIGMAHREGGALSELQAQRLGKMIIYAVANATLEAPELKTLQLPIVQSAQQRILEHAKLYIECNLSNSEVDSDRIAQHCNISVRYLNAVFAAVSTTVGTYIREQRLLQCQIALRNPSLRDKSITEISIRWGFNSVAHFSRAYKAQFGKAPSEERTQGD
jgi:AraC-like DNA-binding protein